MNEDFERIKKKICMSKNEGLDKIMNKLNDQVDSMITENNVENIFEITEKYD